ncbi:MAG TPA: ankyrin repeat domain-containing protein [Gemmatales bacterium]|nr:ankyrin repeat domain-containing protein [Gemmatales bacterium]
MDQLAQYQTAATETIAADDPDFLEVMSAIVAGDQKRLETVLRRRPQLVHGRDVDGEMPLHLAAQYNDPTMGLMLLLFGADPQARLGNSSHTPLSWAVTCHALEFAQMLVRTGLKPDLFVAAGMGSLEMVELCFDERGQLRPGSVQTGSTRFKDGKQLSCPPETELEQIADALYMACRNAHGNVVKFLLTKQPDLHFRAFQGATLLHWAYFGNSTEIISLIEQAGGDPLSRDDLLHVTPRAFGICTPANWGFLKLVERQVRRDPSLVHLVDGTSALHEATRQGHLNIVQWLIRAGADKGMKNSDGKTAAEVATEKGHHQIAQFLN